LNQNGWIPDLFVQTADKPESIRALLDRARVLQDTARARLKPFVEAISDYLTHGPERVLGLHWLGEGYSIKCYRGTGAGISLAYEPIHTWEEEDAIHFYVHIEYTNDEHDWEHSLSRNVEVRAPLSLAENFTKKAFAAWVKAKEDELNAKAIQKAKEALDKAKKLKRA
jgi:hypothetical protein